MHFEVEFVAAQRWQLVVAILVVVVSVGLVVLVMRAS